ncbi:hypothetical protein [Maridesulfovibrio sp. FT414]|uniref:hypothetical protein n=1 Tax=Maridesulfovibrio sp. FT414 TaxID=2979469 RepID=UPI003D806B91
MLQDAKRILVYTDKPDSYRYCVLADMLNVDCCSCPDEFCCSMLKNNYSGQILDMRKMMNTPCCARNRILSFAATTPTLRAVVEFMEPVFLDNEDNFLCACREKGCTGNATACLISVNIPIKISLEDDPAMVNPVTGTIHHIDELGCDFHSETEIAGNSFLYLKIPCLRNSLPIYAGVCVEQCGCQHNCGHRVRFLYVKDDQIKEIQERFIKL